MTSLERIYRIGRKRSGSCRPVILKLFNFNEKQDILKNSKKLKGSNLSISCGYAKETLDKRRHLWKSAESERVRGKKAFLVHDKLRIDDRVYEWDSDLGERRLAGRPGANAD